MNKITSALIITATCALLSACHTKDTLPNKVAENVFLMGQCVSVNALSTQLTYPIDGQGLYSNDLTEAVNQKIENGFSKVALIGDFSGLTLTQACMKANENAQKTQVFTKASKAEIETAQTLIKAGICSHYEYVKQLTTLANGKPSTINTPNLNSIELVATQLDSGRFNVDLTQCQSYFTVAKKLGLHPQAIIDSAKNNALLTAKPLAQIPSNQEL